MRNKLLYAAIGVLGIGLSSPSYPSERVVNNIPKITELSDIVGLDKAYLLRTNDELLDREDLFFSYETWSNAINKQNALDLSEDLSGDISKMRYKAGLMFKLGKKAKGFLTKEESEGYDDFWSSMNYDKKKVPPKTSKSDGIWRRLQLALIEHDQTELDDRYRLSLPWDDLREGGKMVIFLDNMYRQRKEREKQKK